MDALSTLPENVELTVGGALCPETAALPADLAVAVPVVVVDGAAPADTPDGATTDDFVPEARLPPPELTGIAAIGSFGG
jgi:hypothetical protein